MNVICKETVKDIFELETLFTKGKIYEFVLVDNKYTRQNDFIGYFSKDDTKHKRWCTQSFKDEYFIEQE